MDERNTRATASNDVSPSSKRAEVRRLLSEADMLRLRGRWEEAMASCQEAIALDPQETAGHVLLGDLYSAHRDNEQAIRCYTAALEVAEDAVVRLKIEELREREKLPQPSKPRERWAQRWPLRRRARRRQLAAAAALGGLVILVLIVVVLWAQGRKGNEAAPTRGLGAPTPSVGGPAPLAAAPQQPSIPLTAPTYYPSPPPAPAAAPPVAYGSVGGRPAVRGGATASSGYTRRVERSSQLRGPLTDREKRIVYELSQLVLSDGNPIGTYVTATLSPRTESLVVSFEVPDEVAARPAGKLVLAEANRLALTAARVDTGFKSCTVRVLVGYTELGTGSRHTVCIFEAETTRDLLTQTASSAAPSQPYNVFPQPWWNPEYWGLPNTGAGPTG